MKPLAKRLAASSAVSPLVLALSLAAPARAQTAVPTDATLLKAAHSGQCMDAEGASMNERASIIQYPCHGGANQRWRFDPVPGGYHLVNLNSSKCLDVTAGSLDNGAKVIQYTCHSGANQTWIATQTSNGLTLKAAHSGQCLDVANYSRDASTQLIQWPCHGGANQTWAPAATGAQASGAAAAGRWSSVVAFPFVPVSAGMLGNGKIMLWGGSKPTGFGGGDKTYSLIFDPANNSYVSTLLNKPAVEYFCEGTALLADGRYVVTGGSNPASSTIIGTDGAVAATPNLNIPRGYAGQTLTSSGNVLTIGGSWSGDSNIKKGELYTPGGGWRVLDGVYPSDFNTADPSDEASGRLYRADNHMWLIASDNDWVLHAGPAKKMHWVKASGSGQILAAGQRGSSDAMNGNAVVYDVGKILAVGGAPSYSDATPLFSAFTIDISAGGGKTPIVAQTGSMSWARTFANSVVLPTGEVVVIGGQGNGGTPFSDVNSVYAAEVWSPLTKQFRTMASMATPRNYHSVALLMADGRVLSAGGGLCDNCSVDPNHPNAEIWSPPYLFDGNGADAARPTIAYAPATATRGARIDVRATQAASYVLVRFSSVTHSVNNDQRRIPLQVVNVAGDTSSLQIPADAGVVLPGNYMLFAVNGRNTPSLAKIINIR